MERQERAARLKSMLSQVAEGRGFEAVARPRTADPLIEGLESISDAPSDVDLSLGKLEEGREDELSTSDLFTLEAIIMPKERPVVFIRSGTYEDIEEPWTHLNKPGMRSRITPLLRSIGRVEVPSAPWLPFGGTGFVVGRNLLMTNRHVAKLFAEGVGTKLTYRSGDAAVDFKREVDTPANDTSAHLVVQEVTMIHPYWDMALLKVKGLDGYEPLKLSVRKPDELFGSEVVAVGYPARDDRSDLALQDQIFGKKYNVKRLQPGKLRERKKVRSFENVVSALTHDSSTLGGNSGSAIIDVKTGEVIGLHFAGEYLKANYAVPTYELARDRNVVRAKLNFEGSLAPTNDWAHAWQSVSTGESVTLVATPPPVASDTGAAVSQPLLRPQTATSTSVASNNSLTVTVPVRITISIGDAPAAATLDSEAATSAVESPRTKVPVIFGNLENRKGYQPGFLGLTSGEEVPLPELTKLGETVTARLEDGTRELKYHKFSVVMHKTRRLALFTAANVDWRGDSRLINGHKPSRKELTGLEDGTAEQWVPDSRIPEEHQLPDVFFTKDGGAFDKGHLVRRDDVCWGKTFQDIQKANGDTYHTTNCSPQVGAFNRSNLGVENWGDLEVLVQQQTKAEKAILFSGPVLAEDDRLFEGQTEHGKTLIRVPRSFWKIVIVKGQNGPEAYGFVLEQDLSSVPTVEEFAVPKAWQLHMRSIGAIEEFLEGLATLTSLKEMDRFTSDEGVQMAERVSRR